MKNIKNLFVLLFVIAITSSCDDRSTLIDDSEDLLTGGATTAAILKLSGDSSGKLLGAPSSQDFETATVAFAVYELYMEVIKGSGGENVVGYEITKSLNGGAETVVAQSASLPISLEYSTLEEYLDGLGVSEDDLRIGDKITFRTRMTLDDGNVVYSSPSDGTLAITINCFADLSGTYLVTNDGCVSPNSCSPGDLYTTITQNADGSWHIAIGDGGFLGYSCTGNCGLDNWANIVEVCGGILATDALEYSSYGIGNIQGGAWDAVNGILTLDHTQTFTGNWASSWTSTYVRQ